MNNKIIDNLNWRYAVKKYDPSQKISDSDLQTIREAIRLSPSSMGLQPYKVLFIENPEVRAKLREKAFNQTPVTEASYVVVFAVYCELGDKHVQDYMETIATTRNVERSAIAGFEQAVKGAIERMPEKEMQQTWAAKQTYIALGNLLHTCAALKIDATPMEGFDADGFDEILGLEAQNLHTTVICTIGYRHAEDSFQNLTKVRKPEEELFELI